MKRRKRTYFNIFFPKFLYSFFFREATAAILQRSKHSRWDIVIVTLCQMEKKAIKRGKTTTETTVSAGDNTKLTLTVEPPYSL